ncbi:MAG: tetratricopeptide repeat protein [Gemmataceae bacterium]|nr:tetratricopeptide repeat protein [Gemmataceae bacterium]
MSVADETYRHVAELFTEQKYVEAETYARQWLGQYPDNGRLWQLYGMALWVRKEVSAALEALETATTLVPLIPLAQRALADCYAKTRKGDLATLIYRHLLETGRCPTGLLPCVAAALNALGQHELALNACETLAERDPSYHQAYFGIAYYRARLGASLDELVAPLAMATDLAPQHMHYRINLAFVWAAKGDFDRAHELLQPVVLERIQLPCWLLRMRTIFERVGDHQRALECMGHFHGLGT